MKLNLSALLQGYCTKQNENKIVDPDLMTDCVKAVKKHLIEWLESKKYEMAKTNDYDMKLIKNIYDRFIDDLIRELEALNG